MPICYLWADKSSRVKRGSVFISSSVERHQGGSCFLVRPPTASSMNKRWSPRRWISQGQRFAWCRGTFPVVLLSGRRRQQTGRGFPSITAKPTVSPCVHVARHKSAYGTATFASGRAKRVIHMQAEKERESRPACVKVTLCPLLLKKAETLYSNS